MKDHLWSVFNHMLSVAVFNHMPVSQLMTAVCAVVLIMGSTLQGNHYHCV